MARRKRKSLDWFVATCFEGSERIGAKNLRECGFEAEYPLHRLPMNRLGERRAVPLFPGYIFVRSSEFWKDICSTRGIAGLIMNDGCPSRVLDVDVQFFMNGSVDSSGYFVDPRILAIKPGSIVYPRSGPFARIPGEVSRILNNSRCEVIHWMLGNRLASTHAVNDLA